MLNDLLFELFTRLGILKARVEKQQRDLIEAEQDAQKQQQMLERLQRQQEENLRRVKAFAAEIEVYQRGRRRQRGSPG